MKMEEDETRRRRRRRRRKKQPGGKKKKKKKRHFKFQKKITCWCKKKETFFSNPHSVHKIQNTQDNKKNQNIIYIYIFVPRR